MMNFHLREWIWFWGYKHQHLQESYVTSFFYEQNNLRKGTTIPGHGHQRLQL
jgi:hypothetical protein